MFTKNELKELDLNQKLSKILREIYSRPDLNWVKDFVDYLINSETISRKYILEKWNLIIQLEDLDEYTIVQDASYSPETNAITIIINDNIDSKDPDEIITEIKRYVSHEMYHFQQGNNGALKQIIDDERSHRFRGFNDKKLSSIDKKLLKQEIDAHAKDYAKIYDDNGYTVKEAIHSISVMDHPEYFSEIELAEIEIYRAHRLKWKRLLNEMVRYFTEEK